MTATIHENLAREEDVKPGSERGFGLVMAGAFFALAAFKAWFGAATWWIWGVIALAFAATAFAAPHLLAPLNVLWFRFGLLLHRVIGPLVMALLFFGAILPIGLLMRLCGQTPLSNRFDPQARSYWRPRADGRLPPGSMRKQY